MKLMEHALFGGDPVERPGGHAQRCIMDWSGRTDDHRIEDDTSLYQRREGGPHRRNVRFAAPILVGFAGLRCPVRNSLQAIRKDSLCHVVYRSHTDDPRRHWNDGPT